MENPFLSSLLSTPHGNDLFEKMLTMLHHYVTATTSVSYTHLNAIAAGFQGQRQWTDFYPNGDFAEAMLNTSFDWDGAREP